MIKCFTIFNIGWSILYSSVKFECSSERLLGVTINNDLSWNTHVENVINDVMQIFSYIVLDLLLVRLDNR